MPLGTASKDAGVIEENLPRMGLDHSEDIAFTTEHAASLSSARAFGDMMQPGPRQVSISKGE